MPVAKQHKTSHWESSAEGHNNPESNIVQQVFANVELWEVCTADLALLPSDCICTVHCGTFSPLHPRPHMTKTAVLPTTCPAKRECTARPGCSLVRGSVQHTKPIRPNSWIKQEYFQLASPSNPPPSTEPLGRREGNLPLESSHPHIGNWRGQRHQHYYLLCRESDGTSRTEVHIKYKMAFSTLL